jgi:hypothetical protein
MAKEVSFELVENPNSTVQGQVAEDGLIISD